jgi:hypothetical protein
MRSTGMMRTQLTVMTSISLPGTSGSSTNLHLNFPVENIDNRTPIH